MKHSRDEVLVVPHMPKGWIHPEADPGWEKKVSERPFLVHVHAEVRLPRQHTYVGPHWQMVVWLD